MVAQGNYTGWMVSCNKFLHVSGVQKQLLQLPLLTLLAL